MKLRVKGMDIIDQILMEEESTKTPNLFFSRIGPRTLLSESY